MKFNDCCHAITGEAQKWAFEAGQEIMVKSKQQMMDWDVCSGYTTRNCPPELSGAKGCRKLNFF